MSEVVSIPQLRFPEFSGEWRVDKFVDLCKFQQGVQVDVELQSTEPKNNFLRFLRIENYTQKSNDFRYIPKELSSNKSITENEIAIVRYGATAGYIGRGLKGVLANNLFKLVLNKDTLDTDYLFHLLRSYKTFCFFQSEMSGGAMPALSFGIVGALKLPYSSISEQQKIAAFLTAVDNKIEQLSKKQELLGEYKKGAMQQIFSQAIRFKANDDSEFPDWEEKKLGDVCKLQGGYAFKSAEFQKHGIPIIRISNISNNNDFIDNRNLVYYNEIKNSDKFIIKNGDLIVAMSGATTGKSSIYNLIEDAYLNQRVGLFKANNSLLDYGFLIQIVFSYIFATQLDSVLVAGAQPNVSSKDIEGFEISLPSKIEQNKIANFLSSIDSKIEQVGKQLDESKQFKKALLQQMFV